MTRSEAYVLAEVLDLELALVPAKAANGQRSPVGDELLTRADVARIAGVSRTKSFEIWGALDKIVLGPRCNRVRRADLDRYFDELRRRAWR
jgi:hypothetical protein